MGKRVNLFSEKKKVKKVDDRAFDMMTTVADKTDVSIIPTEKKEISSKNIHNALMAAGMSPGYGNIADVADAALYALEGEFGEASLSLSGAIPVIGQMVSGKRLVRKAKDAGEEMVTLYRGVSDWYPGKMVKDRKFVAGSYYEDTGHWGKVGDNTISLTHDIEVAKDYAKRSDWKDLEVSEGVSGVPRVLEFEVPKSWVEKNVLHPKFPSPKMTEFAKKGVLEGKSHEIGFQGMPVEFLKKVHK